MRPRTFAGILFALAVVVSVSYLSNLNEELLSQRFTLTPATSVPLYGALLAVFLAGLLPAATVLLTQSLKRDLKERRDRRSHREAESLKGSFRRAVDFREDRQWAKAATELEALVADQPENFGALLYYGEALRELGRIDDAIDVHRKLSVLYPQGLVALYQLARDYEVRGDAEVAEQIYDRVLRDFPGQGLAVLRQRCDRALREGDWQSAAQLEERVTSMLEGGGDTPTADEIRTARGLRYQQAVAALAEDRFAEALEAVDGLLAEDPDFLPARILRGEALLASGDEEAAIEVWRASFLESARPVFLQRIEDHFIERENPLQAIETLHELTGEARNDLLPRFFLGRLYYRLEMHDEAYKALTALSERIGASPTYHYLLGRIHERRGDMAAAALAYGTSLRHAGMHEAEYVCGSCGERRVDWADRCERCGTWNGLELQFEEEHISPEALGIRERPVYVVDDPPNGS